MPNLSLRKLWRKRSATISERDPSYKVIYLGNMLTGWAKGDGCVDKPLSVLWRNYCQSNRSDIIMKITICSSGLRAVTKEHGLTEYWAHRVTYCGAHPAYPKVFCWVYRHEGRKLKQELRCHAVLCHRSDKAQVMTGQLKERLTLALHEFRREKVIRQNARLSLVHAIYDNATLPTRKVLLSTGTTNYRPPLERSKSAPKLGSIEETIEEEEEEEDSPIEEEDELEAVSEGATGRAEHCSPVNSIAPSETMSDIVHYANGGAELSAGCLLARSASQKGTNRGRESSGAVDVDKNRRPARKFSDRASKSGSSGSSSSTSSGGGGGGGGGGVDSGISASNSNYNYTSTSSSNNSSTNISTNSNDDNSSNNVPSCNVSSSHNNKRLLYVHSRPQPQIVKQPVLKRRFIRSISVDTSFDHDALDLDNFDDEDDDYDSNDEETTNIIQNSNQEVRIESSSCTNVVSSSRGGAAQLMRNPLSCAKTEEGVGRASSDCTDDDLSSSLTSTDTTETVLDRPHTTEDTLSLLNSLSTSLARQLSLPRDPRPGGNTAEESLTSDQPESLGSHCDSCGSSCGGCSSDNGTEIGTQEDCLAREGSARGGRGRRCVMGLVEAGMDGGNHHTRDLSGLSVDDAEEPDNISEESGYAEEKDFLPNTELAKALNA